MITLLLTFAVSGSVYAAQSLAAAARTENSALGTVIGAAKSIARAVKTSAVVPATVTVKPVAKTVARRKACTFKV